MQRTAPALLALLLVGCTGPWLVPGIDGAIGIGAPQPFYYGHGGVPVTIEVSNLGDTAGGPPSRVTVQVSPGVDFVSHGPAAWDCTGAAPLLLCQHHDPLPAGGSLPDLELALSVGSVDEVKDTVRICAELFVENDVNPNNNHACHAYPVHAPTADYDLAITTLLHTALGPNDVVSYIVTVENLGPDPVNEPFVFETEVPPGLTVTGHTLFGCQNLGSALVCPQTQLGAGQTRTVLVVTQPAPGLSGSVTTCGRVSAPQDLNPANDEDCHTFVVGAPDPFDLEVTALVFKEPHAGNAHSATYHWYLHNLGPNATSATFDVVIDAPPPGATLSFIGGIAPTGSGTNTGHCTPAGPGQLACPVQIAIQPGATRTIHMSFFAPPGTAAPACLSIDPLGDTDPTNNSACLALDVPPPDPGPVLSVTLDQVSEARAGQIGALRLTVENPGAEDVPDPALLFLDMPPGVTLVGLAGSRAFDCNDGAPVGENTVVTCVHDGPIPAGHHVHAEVAVYYESAGSWTVCADTAPAEGDRRCMPIDVSP